MSKRSAGWQGGEERYGAYAGQQQQEDMSQQPQQATAAQLAKRKIASLKGSRRPRSESPLTTGGSIFEQANQSGLMANNNMQNQNNSFSSAQGFNFGGGNANGVSSSFGSGGNSSFNFGGNTQTTQPSTTSFTFGGTSTTPSTNSFTFGSSQPQEKQTNGQTSGAGFSFGQPQENGTAQKPVSNIFGGAFGAQSSTPSSNMFSTAQTTPSNPFAGINQTSQDSSKGFSFGNNTNHEVKTPQPSSNASNTGSIFAGFGQTQAKPVEQPSSNGWSSFLGQTSATPKPAVSDGLPPSTSIFATSQTNGQTNGTSQSIFGNAPSKTPTFDFGAKSQATTDNDASMMSPENTPQKPATQNIDSVNTNGFSTHASTDQTETNKSLFAPNKGKSLFERITKDPVNASSEAQSPASNLFTAPKTSTSLFTASTPAVSSNIFNSSKPAAEAPTKSAQPQSSLFQPSAAKTTSSAFDAASQPTTQQSTTAAKVTSMESTAPEHFDAIRELNEGLTQHLQDQDNERDWSSIFQFYQLHVAKISSASSSTEKPSASQPFGSTTSLGNSVLGKSSLSQPTSSLFTKSAMPASASNESLSKSTSTAQAEYPKLPENSSATAKLFESTLDQAESAPAKAASSLFAPSTPAASIFSQSNSSASTTTFKPSTSSLFAPQTNGDKSDATKSAPSGGFVMPKAASSGSFLSLFGAQAKANEEKEKKRRRDEDFDSDEDDAAEWEKKDAEEQAAKKAKLEEVAKSATGFVFKPSSDKPATSIFSNIKTSNGESTSENTQGEDHTWKQGTPIKFGDASATATTPKTPGVGLFGSSTKTPSIPPGSGLFGASIAPQNNSTGSIFGAVKTPQPTNASVFSQPAAPASKPDEQVNGEAADGDAEPLLPQLADMAVLLESEQSENDVLYHVEKAKSRKNELRHVDGKGEQLTWVEKGLGPVWILRNKSTGKARVLQKVKDSGRVAMNFAVLKGFEPRYGGAKSVVCTFVDHLAGKDSSKPSSWQIQVGKVEDAKEIDRVLREESKKA